MKLSLTLTNAALGAAALAAALGAATPAHAENCGETYTVRAGDWLSKIAQRCGVEMDAIAALNDDLNPNAIEIGQVIRLKTPDPIIPVFDLQRVPVSAMPPSPPSPPAKGPVQFEGEIVRDAGTCLYVSDPAGRLYSFAAGERGLTAGTRVTISGEVVDNWFCGGGAEVLVDAVEPAPAQMATLETEAL